jgi:hypothetical protein
MNKVIHLHHCYWRGSKLLAGLRLGYSLCNTRVSGDELTAFLDDTTCKVCIVRHKEKEIERANA